MYYKAVVGVMHETLDLNGFATGDLDDLGIVETVCNSSIRALFSVLASKYRLTDAEVFENRLELSCEVTERDKPYIESISIYITAVEETDLIETTLQGFLNEVNEESK